LFELCFLSLGKRFCRILSYWSKENRTIYIKFLFLIFLRKFRGEGHTIGTDYRMSDLPWGCELKGTCERKGASFYRLVVEQSHFDNGFFLLCRSNHKSNFKMALMDGNGDVLYEEDGRVATTGSIGHGQGHSSSSSGTAEAIMYFTRFDTYKLVDPSSNGGGGGGAGGGPGSMHSMAGSQFLLGGVGGGAGGPARAPAATLSPGPDDQNMAFFCGLDGLCSSKRRIAPGEYLLCVQCAHQLGRTSFWISAVPAKNDLTTVIHSAINF
jgi:hypothetical protein